MCWNYNEFSNFSFQNDYNFNNSFYIFAVPIRPIPQDRKLWISEDDQKQLTFADPPDDIRTFDKTVQDWKLLLMRHQLLQLMMAMIDANRFFNYCKKKY